MNAPNTPKLWKLVQVAGFIIVLFGVVAASVGAMQVGAGGAIAVLGILVWLIGRFGAWWQHD